MEIWDQHDIVWTNNIAVWLHYRIPESRVSRWPLEMMLLTQVNSEVVSSSEAFLANMALVPGS